MSDNTATAGTADRLASKLGFWAAVTASLTFVLYTICFVAILRTSPVFMWTTLADYLAYTEAYGGPFQPLAQGAMILFALSFVVVLNAIHARTSPEKRVLTRVALSFGLLFAVAVSIHYFAQLSAVRLAILEGHTEGLEHFVQGNPYSMLSAINMLGWSVFLGLASLFVAPMFSAGGVEGVVRLALLLNGVFCLSGGIGYVFEITWLVFVTTTLGMGGAVLVAMTALSIWFGKGGGQGGT